jgi:hypothetical protein
MTLPKLLAALVASCFLLPACSVEETCPEGYACAPTTSGAGGSVDVTSSSSAAGGGSGSTSSDASSSASTGGAGGGMPEPDPRTVRVLDQFDTPAIAFDVVVNDADGAVIDHGLTDVNGEYVATIPFGGSVSVLYTTDFASIGETGIQKEVVTVYPGDSEAPVILMRFTTYTLDPEPVGSMTLQTYAPLKAGATSYHMQTSCTGIDNASSPNLSFQSVSDCSNDGLFDVLLMARDAEGHLVDYVVVADQEFVDGGSDIYALSWPSNQLAGVSVSIQNIPTAAQSINVSTNAIHAAHGEALGIGDRTYIASPGNEVSTTHMLPLRPATEYCRYGFAILESENDFIILDRCSTQPDLTPFQWDISRLARFAVDAASVTATKLRWDEAWAGEPGDVVAAMLDAGQGTTSKRWRVFLRPGAAELTRPDLPDSLAEYRVGPADVLGGAQVVHRDFVDMDGFDAFLAVGELWDQYESHWNSM